MYNSKLVWILSDNKSGWVDKLLDYGFVKAELLGERGQSSEAALSIFKEALKVAAPKFAFWTFAKERGEAYAKNLSEFLSVCKQNGVTPVLSTYLEGGSKKKNLLTVNSGEKYVDFAALSEYGSVANTSGYSKVGKEAVAARALVDFPELITPDLKVRTATANLCENGKLSLGANKVRDGKYMVFTAKINGELKGNAKITFGHGYMVSYGKWVEIGATEANFPRYVSWVKPAYKASIYPHNMTVKNYITVVLGADNDGTGNTVTVITDGGIYKKRGYGWNACEGDIFVSCEGVELTDVKASWTCEDYSAPIWFVGASYFSLGDPGRWPYYMYADGYADKVFITGRGGMNGLNGHEEIADALRFGKPKYMIWGIGMNDGPDVEGDINPVTYDNKLNFLKICKENGIQPLFMTIPNCGNETNQRNDNTYKLDYILNHRKEFADYEYRVADIAHAVNGIEAHAPWYDGMLHSDGTHPTALGARNFYLELLCAFPELMIGADAKITEKSEAALPMGSEISVTADAPVSDESAITFMADFKDKTLSGVLEIGSEGKGAKTSFVRLTEQTVEVYKFEGGKETLVHTEENRMNMKDIVMLRVHIKEGKASIAFVSSGEKNYAPHSELYRIEAEWTGAEKAYAVANETDFTNVNIKLCAK